MQDQSKITLLTFASELERQRDSKRDFLVDSSELDFQIETGGRVPTPVLSWENTGEFLESPMNKTARAQLASRLGIPKRFFDRLLSDPNYHRSLATTVNSINVHESKTTLVRTMDGNCRALLSDRYRRIDNFEVMDAVLPVLRERPDLEFRSANLSDDRMHFQAIFPETRADIGRGDTVTAGVVISNSEVGKGSFRVEPMIWRLVCLNGMISTSAIRKYHVGRKVEFDEPTELFTDETMEADDKALALKMRDVVRASLDQAYFETQVDLMRTAAGIEIAAPTPLMKEITRRYELPEGTESRLMELFLDSSVPGVTQAGRTAFGVVNALTAYAKEVGDYDRGVEVERLGGKLLSLGQVGWTKLIAEAV